ncbi:MAG: D-alanyl-D-alanine carboxypeptidase [Clostridia bacterium]|nr:D-alanyl-D-alanine carboxypeptidase [Clostridia bacterium]
MKKTCIALILIFSLVFSIPASAFQINDYELHHTAGMLVSLDTGDVLYSKNITQKIHPAAITSIMSAVVACENITDLKGTKIIYSKKANNKVLGTGLPILQLKIGEEITAYDAVASMLIPSCADAAFALAEYVGGSIDSFVEMMNEKADALGLENTNFTNPVGLDDKQHYTTAQDIYKLMVHALKNDIIKELLSKSRYTVSATNMSDERIRPTVNFMLNPNSDYYYRYAKGGKTGLSKDGRCIVSTASYNGYNYLAIVLGVKTSSGTRTDFNDCSNMFRWAFNNFEYKTVLEGNEPVTEAPVELSAETDHISLCFEGGLKTLLPKEADASTVDFKINLNKESFDAPINKGDILGTADIYYAEEKLGTLNLVATQSVKSSAVLVFARAAKNFFTSTFMKIVYVIIAAAAIIFLGSVIKMNMGKGGKRKVKYIPLRPDEFDDDIKED